MSHIVEMDEHGTIQLPEELVATLSPPARYVVELSGATVILHPASEQPLWTAASPAERAAAVCRWAAEERPSAPVLADAMLSREHLYD